MPLVSTREMLARAYEGGYAVGAFNINNMEILQGIVSACSLERSPLILQVSTVAMDYIGIEFVVGMTRAAAERYSDIPIALHLDHGPDFETCRRCVDAGFTSVMIDASSKPFEENIALSKQVAEYAHARGVSVEAELGVLAGTEDELHRSSGLYTDPDEVEEFVSRTGVDSLAIAIGTSHGAFKFRPEQCRRGPDGRLIPPSLRFDILRDVERRLPGFPIVLHGSSSIPQEYVHTINSYGGGISQAIGIPDEQLREAAKLAVCKINVDSDLRLAMTAAVREYLALHPETMDPRAYIGQGRRAVRELVRSKIVHVLGSGGRL